LHGHLRGCYGHRFAPKGESNPLFTVQTIHPYLTPIQKKMGHWGRRGLQKDYMD